MGILGVERLYHTYDPVQTKEGLVSDLTDLIEDAYAVVSQQTGPGDDELSDSDGSESEESESECKTADFNNEDDILDALDTYTTSLMDLRPILEQSLSDSSKPSTKRASIPPPEFHVTESARPYVLQVHDKYREAKSALVERLGEANWQRYVRIKAMMEAAANRVTSVRAAPETIIPEIPKSTFRPISLFHDSGLGTSVPSRSQYAASNASHTSFLSTDTDVVKGRLRVPSTPMEVSEGIAFTCFICTQRLSGIRNRVDWKMHVFADLHPYICTFPDCPNLLTTYPTRKLWAEHEFTTHRSHEQYECHDCSQTFIDENEFVDHINDDHQYKELNHTQLLATISAAKQSVLDPLNDQACPLCHKTSWTLQRDFVTHLGRHLEEIALSSLPRDDDSESESGSEADTEVSNATGKTAHQGPNARSPSAADGDTMLRSQGIPKDTNQKMVKVYELREDDWFDRGTGFCTGQIVNGEPKLFVESKDQPDKLLLETVIVKDDGYQKQQDTWIVWTEKDGTDMALSFLEVDGCAAIWEFVKQVQF